MLIEVYRGGYHVIYHDTETGTHQKQDDLGHVLETGRGCWHSPENPCPAVEQKIRVSVREED